MNKLNSRCSLLTLGEVFQVTSKTSNDCNFATEKLNSTHAA